jgi:hypothetical protein
VIWHFAHYAEADCSLDDPDYGPESHEHKLLKWAIYQWLTSAFGESRVHVEKKIETDQVADVLLVANKRRIAFEVQRSPISAEAWQERRDKYRSASVHDVWVLVGDRHFNLIRHESPSEGSSTEHRSPEKEIVRESPSQDTTLQTGNGQSAPVCKRIITLDPGHLARGLFAADGRLLWIPEDAVDHLKEKTSGVAPPNPSSVKLREIDGIGWVYRNAEGNPTEAIEQLRRRPFPEQPRHLVARNTWRAVSNTGKIGGVLSPPISLPECDLSLDLSAQMGSGPEARTSRPTGQSIVFEGPYRSAQSYSNTWAWEHASRQWAAAWKRRKRAHEKRARRAQAKARKALYAEIGKVVYDRLPAILKGCRALYKSARDMDERAVRNYRGLEQGIRKWSVQNWTPLADLDTGLDWAFGVDRRLWQMIAYATQFYHSYAKKYRERVGLHHVKGYKHVASGYLLKALGEAQLLKRPSLYKTLADTSEEVKTLLQQAPTKITVEIPPKSSYKRRQRVETDGGITLHGVRHIAAASYLARLAHLGFLDGSGPVYDKRMYRYLVRARHLVGRSHVTSREYVLIGRAWLDVAAHCTHLQARNTQSFFIKSPFYPPFFADDERALLAHAIDEDRGPLHVGERDLRDRHGAVLVSLDWK